MEYKKWLHMASFLLTVVGGLNWGLVGLLNFNLVTTLFGAFANYVYDLVGLSALYLIFSGKKM